MELLAFYIVTVCALLALGAICFRQTLRALDMQRQIETLGRRADEYAAALLKLPDMGGVRELQFTDKARGVQAEMEAAALTRMKRRAKPTADDFARHVPPELREGLRSPRTPLDQGGNYESAIPPAMIAHELRRIRDTLEAPGGDPATLHAAARATPMPAMLDRAGVQLSPGTRAPDAAEAYVRATVANLQAHGGSVTTPGKLD